MRGVSRQPPHAALHASAPGIAARGYARGGSYARLGELVCALAAGAPRPLRILDLASGASPLLAGVNLRMNVHSLIRVDRSLDELAHAAVADGGATGDRICADAAALPLAAASVDLVVCHLAFMLFADPAEVVAELARVLAPGGEFLAVLGGGPTADAASARPNALAWFADQLPPRPGRAALTERRWLALFAGWRTSPWERWEVDLSGSLEEVTATLAANYEAVDTAALRAAFPRDPIPCRAALYLTRATRPDPPERSSR